MQITMWDDQISSESCSFLKRTIHKERWTNERNVKDTSLKPRNALTSRKTSKTLNSKPVDSAFHAFSQLLRAVSKMIPWFPAATVYEAAVPINTTRTTKFGLAVFGNNAVRNLIAL